MYNRDVYYRQEKNMVLNSTQKAMLQSYGRSFLGAALALYLAGNTDPYTYLYAFVAAFAPVAIRYFNKNDIAFGRINGNSTADEVAAEVVSAIKKATAKKTATKKTPSKKVSPSQVATKKTEK
jgi:hypothetical protein